MKQADQLDLSLPEPLLLQKSVNGGALEKKYSRREKRMDVELF